MNPSPVTIPANENYKMVKEMISKYGISSFLVVK